MNQAVKTTLLLLCLTSWGSSLFAQTWVELLEDPEVNFNQVQQAFESQWGNRPYERGKGWKQYKRWEFFMEDRSFPHGKRPRPNKAWEEHLAFKNKYRQGQNWGSRSANWQPLGPNNWTNQTGWNPGNGRINCTATDPNNSNVLYAGAPSGGLWKSTNGGQSWSCLTDHLPVLGVSAILVDPNNSNHLYIGTGDGDGSDTYSIGVLESVDGGANWSTTGLSFTGRNRLIRRMIMHPTNNQIIFAATNNGIYRTVDGGTNWSRTQTGSMRDVEFKPGDPNTVYACTDEFYKSTDGGQTFSKITVGLPAAADVNRASIAVSPANPNYLYILFGVSSDAGYYGIYRSTNSGQSFSLQSNSPNIFTYETDGSGTGGQSWYDMALAVSPSDANEVYAGGINVWKSNDGGANWRCQTHWVHPNNLGYVHADIHTLDFFGAVLHCGSDGGFSTSADTGATWTFRSAGMEITQFYRIGVSAQSAYRMIGGAQDNGTNYLENGTWLHALGGDGMEAAIDPSNSQIMYGCIQNGALRRTTNGGQNWSSIKPANANGGAWITPYQINPLAPNELFAGYEEVWKTTDRGDNWTQISNFGTGSNLRYLHIAPSNANYIYTGTYSTLYRTSDGGQNWSTITPNLPNNSAIKYLAIHPNNPNQIWLALSGYNAGEKVVSTSDGGQTWSNVSANLPNLPINCIVYQNNSHNGIYVGTDVGVYYTDSTLSNWQSYMTGLPNVPVYELEIHDGIDKIRAATYGRGVWESDLFGTIPTPPTASFMYNSQLLCASDSLQFTDLSSNASPGWQWSFPGGSPASSTLANPKVHYPASGSYTASLIVQNQHGADTIQQQVQVNYAPNELNLVLDFDNYASETSWEVLDQNGQVLASGGGYANGANSQIENVCLGNGCFTLNVYDSYGDGICCNYGSGSYQLLDAQGNILVNSTGQFTSQESNAFCLNQSAPLVAGTPQATVAGCGQTNASLTASASGGDGNYNYSLDGTSFQANAVFNNLAAGNYTVYVQDGQGQQSSTTIQITEQQAPRAQISSSSTQLYLDQGATINLQSVLSTNAASYQWNLGDGTTSGLASLSHSYSQAGQFWVVLSALRDNCSDQDSLLVTVDLTNAVSQSASAALALTLFPHPVQTSLQFTLELPKQQDKMEVFIHNALGQLLYWEEVEQPQTELQRQIHLGNQANGAYILSIKTDDFSYSKPFIKAAP